MYTSLNIKNNNLKQINNNNNSELAYLNNDNILSSSNALKSERVKKMRYSLEN